MEHDDEPVRGLPARLPEGEHILWQGAPDWRSLARRAYHLPAVALYALVFTAWSVAAGLVAGESLLQALATSAWIPVSAAIGGAILAGLAFLAARATIYTVTNKRVVFRIGAAVSKAVNVPFTVVETAALKQHKDGTGDIPLIVSGPVRIGYMQLWPHVRPWRLARPEPMLRCVPDAVGVARLLATAMAAALAERGGGRADVSLPDAPAPAAPGTPRPASAAA